MRLTEYLPEHYRNSVEVFAMQEAMQPEITALWAARDGLLEQLNVTTATWGLEAWERAVGLSVDVSKPVSLRRARVMARMRGQGTATVALIQNIAEGYTDMDVEVEERAPEYRIEIRFIGVFGAVANMDDLENAIREVIPAHLAYDYVFLYQAGTLMARCGFFGHTGLNVSYTMKPF